MPARGEAAFLIGGCYLNNEVCSYNGLVNRCLCASAVAVSGSGAPLREFLRSEPLLQAGKGARVRLDLETNTLFLVRLAPSRPNPPSDYPEKLIEEAETRARMPTLQRDELLTRSEILKFAADYRLAVALVWTGLRQARQI